MTSIFIDKKEMVVMADSLITNGFYKNYHKKIKVINTKKYGLCLVVGTGLTSLVEECVHVLQNAGQWPQLEETGVYLLTHEGHIVSYGPESKSENSGYLLEGRYCFGGSGGTILQALIEYHGIDPSEAFETTKKVDIYTGGEVQKVWFGSIEFKPQKS